MAECGVLSAEARRGTARGRWWAKPGTPNLGATEIMVGTPVSEATGEERFCTAISSAEEEVERTYGMD